MRLKTFTAKTLSDAMHQVRRALGDDAAIVSTRTDPDSGEIQVVASLSDSHAGDPRFGQQPMPPEQRADQVLAALLAHGVPLALADRLTRASSRMDAREPLATLAGALSVDFSFQGLEPDRDDARLMLVGPPGSGKTLTLIKLATQAVLAKRPVRLLTTDLRQAGAVEQLTAFGRILELEVFIAEDAEELAEHVARTPTRTAVFIDSSGTNPFDEAAMDALASFTKAAPVEPVLVLYGGLDAMEAAETAISFAAAGVSRMIASRLDTARRYGSILAAMEAGSLALAGVTESSSAADGLAPAGPVELTEYMFADAPLLLTELPPRAADVSPAQELWDTGETSQ